LSKLLVVLLLAPSPVERQESEFSDLDDWMREADRVIRKSQEILDRLSPAALRPSELDRLRCAESGRAISGKRKATRRFPG
jgi:hypothetical protein